MPDDGNAKRVLDLCDEILKRAEEERDAFLQQACAGDDRLRASVQSVLLAVSAAGDFLDADALSGLDEGALLGQRIGHYTLQKKLGHGGMGAVYLAAREDDDFDQQVAIKLVHGHLLTRELVERFNAERKILATLNHPYIAGLIDGGTTENGCPYLVMEYIDGAPIDQYCNDNNLSIPERVRLIRKVALAVEAAHRRLVVHRDLKPSNVLVTADGIPKLLDFGIAKLVQPPSPDNVDHTIMFGHQAVTPDYASPEQILENTVTTVSDVYSLGILTYELLLGERPYHIDSGSHRALVEAVQGLTVQRPSVRVETISPPAVREQIVRDRGTTANGLRRSLRGDLDNILLKALQRDPGRRYESVALFSADLANYSAGLPITARADSLRYRVGKFVKRNWLATGSAGLVLLSLLVGLVVTQQQKNIARLEAGRANKVTSFLQDVLMAPSAIAGAPITSGQSATVRDLIGFADDRVERAFPDEPEIQAQLYSTLAQAYRGLGEWDKAVRLSDKALRLLDNVSELSEVQATARIASALIRFHAPASDISALRPTLLEAERFAARSPGIPSKVHAQVLHILGQTEASAHDMERVMRAAGQEWLDAGGNPDDDLLAVVHYKLGQIKLAQGRLTEAETELAQSIDILDGDGSRSLIDLGFSYETMGVVKIRRGDYEAARAYLTSAIRILEQSAGRNPWRVVTLTYLSEAWRLEGNLVQAQQTLDRARQLAVNLELSQQAPHWTLYSNQQAELDLANGRFRRVVDDLSTRLDESSTADVLIPHRVKSRYLIALAHASLGEHEAANTLGSSAYHDFVQYYGNTDSAEALRQRLVTAGIELSP